MKISLQQNHLFGKSIYPYLTKTLVLCLLVLTSQVGLGQNLSNKSRFSTDYIQGCAPLTVNLTDLGTVVDNNAPILVHFNRDPGDPESLSGILNSMSTGGTIDTTYTTPGTYLIGQVNGNVTDPNDRFDFIQVVVTAPEEPIFDIILCANNNILVNIDFDSDSYGGYHIDFGDGQSTTIDKAGTPLVNHAYATQNNYMVTVTGQVQNGSNTSCLSATRNFTTVVNIPPPIITELSIQSPTSALFQYNNLESSFGYTLEVDDGSGFRFTSVISPLNNPTSYTLDDPSFDFINQTYTFRITASDDCLTQSGVSNEIPSIALMYAASYNNNQIDLTFDWITSSTGLTELFRIRDGNIIGTGVALGQELISISDCSVPISFHLEANFNGTVSTSIIATPDLTTGLTPPTPDPPEILFNAGGLLLRWQAGQVTSSEYVIYRKNTDGNFVEVGTTTSSQFNDTGLNTNIREVCYRISYRDQCGNQSALSIEICEDLSNLILVPNVFTPNGDNQNDIFRVADGVYRNFQFYIYNRWGALIFASNNSASGWDGTHNGQLSPPGTYIYRIRYFDLSDQIVTLSGNFLLIR